MYLAVFYVGKYGCMGECVGVYTKSKSSELSPLELFHEGCSEGRYEERYDIG
jgi:hypothetical protein